MVQIPYARSDTVEAAHRMKAAQPSVGLSGPAGNQSPETHREYVPPGGRNGVILALKNNPSGPGPTLAVYGPGKPMPINFECVAGVLPEEVGAIRHHPD